MCEDNIISIIDDKIKFSDFEKFSDVVIDLKDKKMEKVTTRRKRCYECQELFNDEYIKVCYSFKSIEVEKQWEKIKYDTDRDIMEFIDLKSKHYLCEYCYDYYI